MTKVLITGGSGLIGKPLSKMLLSRGHEVVHLSRSNAAVPGVQTFRWVPEKQEMDDAALEGVEAIIHLAGAGIADHKWTDERKREIIDSRVKSAELLLERCRAKGIRLNSYISASAVGWYPLIISDKMHDETTPPGEGFLAEVCQLWEKGADAFKGVADHVAKLRIGLVLTKDGGALKRISVPVNYYVSAGLGSGRQAMSWIHLNDVCGIFTHVLEHDLSGVYNAVGPEPATNLDFMQTLADVMERPMLLPNVPEFVIRTLFGQQADLLLRGVPLSSQKIRDTGYSFEYPTLNTALSGIYF